MINANDLLECVIQPTLKMLAEYNSKVESESAEHILLGTAAVESKMGYHLKQVGGPACGIYQIEPDTHDSIINNFVNYRPELVRVLDKMRAPFGTVYNLSCNLIYATAICRLKYWTSPGEMPHADDIDGMAAYWKTHYNTWRGQGTIQKFIDAYGNYVRGNI